MGHIFQVECWEKHPREVFLWIIMAKWKLAMEMAKTLERQRGIY